MTRLRLLAFVALCLGFALPAHAQTATATSVNTATATATPTNTPPPTRGITPVMLGEIPRGPYGPTYRFQLAAVAAGYNRVTLSGILPQSGYSITEIQLNPSTTTAANATPTGASCAYDANTVNVAYMDIWCTAGVGATVYIEISMIANTPVPTATP